MQQEVVLALLAKEPSHGYQLRTRLREALGPVGDAMNAGQIYVTLTRLDKAGLVTSDKEGRVVSHRLQSDGLQVLGDWLNTRRSFWTNSFSALDRALQAPGSATNSSSATSTADSGTTKHNGKREV